MVGGIPANPQALLAILGSHSALTLLVGLSDQAEARDVLVGQTLGTSAKCPPLAVGPAHVARAASLDQFGEPGRLWH